MFDVSWDDDTTETVGSRRQRKERDAERSFYSGSTHPFSTQRTIDKRPATEGVKKSQSPVHNFADFFIGKNDTSIAEPDNITPPGRATNTSTESRANKSRKIPHSDVSASSKTSKGKHLDC